MILMSPSIGNTPFADDLRQRLGDLLTPVRPQSPAGESLRYEPLYDQIREARRSENPALPQGVWQRPPVQADWGQVAALTTDVIAHHSKDLNLAVWRTEALLHLHGFAGYTEGCYLVYGLHLDFAADMHPAPELNAEQTTALTLPLDQNIPGVDNRLNLIQWMNEKLALQLKLLPMTAPDELTGVRAFSLADLESARFMDPAEQRKGSTAARESGVVLFEQSIASTPDNWLLGLWSELQQAHETTVLLDELFDVVYGKENPGLLKIKEVLEQMLSNIVPALHDRNVSLATFEAGEDLHNNLQHGEGENHEGHVTEEQAMGNDHGAPIPTGITPILHSSPASADNAAFSMYAVIRTREDAYRQLIEIANFLGRLEPHSPVPYLLRRAVSWGGMSLEELLPELLSDQAAVRDVGSLLHFKRSSGSSTP